MILDNVPEFETTGYRFVSKKKTFLHTMIRVVLLGLSCVKWNE